MGGGYGLFAASGYRVLTQRSKLAFPEITIGLFPDAGGSWVLKNSTPTNCIVPWLNRESGECNGCVSAEYWHAHD